MGPSLVRAGRGLEGDARAERSAPVAVDRVTEAEVDVRRAHPEHPEVVDDQLERRPDHGEEVVVRRVVAEGLDAPAADNMWPQVQPQRLVLHQAEVPLEHRADREREAVAPAADERRDAQRGALGVAEEVVAIVDPRRRQRVRVAGAEEAPPEGGAIIPFPKIIRMVLRY